MPINMKNISEMFEKDVFTNKGIYCGKVTNIKLDLKKFKISSILIEAAKGSYLANMVGSKKGIIVPFRMVQSVGDIVIIKHISAPVFEEEGEMVVESKEEGVSVPF